MKNLSPIWFLRSPVDEEHKHYILLDFLQSVKEDLNRENIYYPVKKIFSLIKEMNIFRNSGSFSFEDYEDLTEEDLEILEEYSQNPPRGKKLEEIEKIINSSLKHLYGYADLGINLIKKIESKIKIFSLNSLESHKEGGITIFRNMSTNKVYSYWWKKTEIKISGSTKKGIILKNILLPNDKFSMSYEFILHECLDSIGIRNGSELPCTIIEISEDFNQNSEIFKIAKDKFIQELEIEN